MIINRDKKIIVLLTPKTGSTTVRTIFNQWFVPDYGSHADLSGAAIALGDSINEYVVYAFHRNPIDRVLSALTAACLTFVQLAEDRHSVQEFLAVTFPGLGIEAPERSSDERDRSNVEHLYSLDIGVVAKPSEILKRFGGMTGGLAFQLQWVQDPRIQLLSYENYDESINLLCSVMGVDVPSSIPKENSSGKRQNIEDLPQSEVDFIREYYKKDYEFFDSKGISY